MALYSRLSSGENLGGIRLVRGYDNMEKAMARMAGPLPPRRPLEHVDDPYFAGQAMDALPVLEPERSTETTPMSEKPHLLTAEDLSTPGGTAKPPPLPAPPKQPKPPPKIKHLVLCVHGYV